VRSICLQETLQVPQGRYLKSRDQTREITLLDEMVITKVAEIPMEEAIRIKEEVEEEVVVGEVMEESPIFNPH
jgi:hypothetical protein